MSNKRTYIIAEAGVNHNGSVTMAKELIDVAAECGADAVKFQTFRAEQIVSKTAAKAEYQKQTTNATESQYDMIKKLELDEDVHEILNEYCQLKGIQFLSTPFDLPSVKLLVNKFDLPYIKIPSGEITNAPFLLEIAKSNKPVILSTGMSTLGEIESALSVLTFGYLDQSQRPCIEAFRQAYSSVEGQQVLQQKVSLLHCTTEYPAPFSEVNLKAMDTLRNAFGLVVGFSDHTSGIAVPIAAVARGAAIIEKHFTLNNNLPGPDHKASLEPEELKKMVEGIRQIEDALGQSCKIPTTSESKNKVVARKSLIANRAIGKGEKFTMENLTSKRPGNGISPMYYWELLGKNAERDYEQDERVGL
jgi:N-acetylneuraminate synthase